MRRENRTKIEEEGRRVRKERRSPSIGAQPTRAYIYARVEKRGEEERKHTCKKGT
tara:strand:- start:872 stop:1036 length:165 start_codon:yes stop_codon:yes gene_type:complete